MAEQRNTELSTLVRDRRAELGLSGRAVAERSGGEVKSAWLSKLERNIAAAPVPEQLRGLALALELPLRLVQEAAAAQFLGMGEVWSGDHRVRVLVARIEEMSPEDVEQLSQIADTFSRARRPAKSSE